MLYNHFLSAFWKHVVMPGFCMLVTGFSNRFFYNYMKIAITSLFGFQHILSFIHFSIHPSAHWTFAGCLLCGLQENSCCFCLQGAWVKDETTPNSLSLPCPRYLAWCGGTEETSRKYLSKLIKVDILKVRVWNKCVNQYHILAIYVFRKPVL